MRSLLSFLLASLLLISCASETPPTEEEASVHPDTSGEGWVDLFAADLSNAIAPEGDVWTFEDGVLSASEDMNIWTTDSYDNFVLDLEYKTAEATNSGVIIYASDTDEWIPNSIEIQIADDHSEKFAEWPAHYRNGAVFGHKPATGSMVKQPGEWNRFTIRAVDNMISVALNGEWVNEFDMSLYTSAETNPDGSEIPAWLSNPVAELATQGYIGLQGKHGDALIWFRNLKVKAL